ncbi:MAG TPA: efflux RND transporter periplasmic adaptor subunit [Balneolaceae bacterium]|nr:efflux RND transporter periplasmic adaptor subunit [Balneolaceae bacterium]
MKTQISFKQTAKISGLLLTGLLLGWLFFGGSSAETVNMDQHIAETHTDEEGNIVYTCSMHPQVRKSEPGNCPICGMELIPVGSSESGQPENPQALTMTPVAMKLADVATAEVVSTEAVNRIRMPGKVAVDERKISVIPAYFPGRIEELYVNFTGAYIEKGDKLASVYAPELITAQKELLEAYRRRKSNPVLYRSARQKLENWELSEQQIDAIIQAGEPQTNFTIRANQSGYVLDLNIATGDYIKPGQPLLKMADLSSVWVLFQAYENDIMGMNMGDSVQFTVAAYPGQTFEAEVTYIDPIVGEKHRTITVRTEVANKDGLLKPNMLVKGVVSATLYEGQPTLQIPRSAVMWTGKRSIVYVKVPGAAQRMFAAREVVLGPRVGDNYVVIEGLKEGEEVVVQGNFMIDAAAQLAGKLSMMNREPGSGGASRMPGMPGMNMGGDMENSSSKMKMDQPSRKIFPESENTNIDKVQVPDAFKEQLDEVVDAYLEVKNALTKDDLQTASLAANGLKEVLSDIDMNLIKDDQQMKIWMTHLDALKKHIEAVEQAEGLEEFRKQFALLSGALAETLTTFGVERPLYVQFCPMALEGEGAYWVSAQEQITNPYLGQMMPECGEVKKQIKPNE